MLGVMALYGLLMFVGGVASIYAYDAHLENQSLELTAMLAPVEISRVEVPERHQAAAQVERSSNEVLFDTRRTLMLDTNNPTLAPDHVSTERSNTPPIRPNMPVVISDTDTNAILRNSGVSDSVGIPGGTGHTSTSHIEVEGTTPPPVRIAPTPTAPKTVHISAVLNGKAVSLPKPSYPQIALQAHVGGVVTVQVLIDEAGRVVSAKAISGHVLLQRSAEQAAVQARFSPTMIDAQPVRVSGVITYNFVLP